MQILRIGVPDIGHKSLAPQGEDLYLQDSSQLWITVMRVGFVGETASLPLIPCPYGPLLQSNCSADSWVLQRELFHMKL